MDIMYKLHPAVYIADDITVKKSILTRWLNSPRKMLKVNYYVIYLSDREDELLTMVPAKDIGLSAYDMRHRWIVGVGSQYYGSMGVIHRIIRDVLDEKGEVTKDTVAAFFQEKEVTADES